MQILLNTDANIDGDDSLSTEVNRTVHNALKRFSEHITRVEVHLRDEDSDRKSGNDDMRCVMEARLEGRQPVAVTHHGATVTQAVDGCADKLHRMIDSTLGRLQDR